MATGTGRPAVLISRQLPEPAIQLARSRAEVDAYLAAQRTDLEEKRAAAREADPMFYQKLAAARRTAIAS